MKKIQALVVSAALAIATAAPVSAGINDPEVLIYRFPGVRGAGNAPGVGVATVFHCTNFSGVTEAVRFATRDRDSTLMSNATVTILHLWTKTVSTHLVNGA